MGERVGVLLWPWVGGLLASVSPPPLVGAAVGKIYLCSGASLTSLPCRSWQTWPTSS